ncbi:Predicted arabinose efflux permease, MFS family [Dyadobacter soli]|uniref:Predicted arabinose efflux permease, MFS family n=1 Tax=Dyadobacter soli TaxID=659014 RepID=A0A1G7SHL2_9BACT|nr:MFS transporter [Dyadobacter soli]SDG22483.1 Predicted arabinose efflux permease, MFS family [Dyadobacter soli]
MTELRVGDRDTGKTNMLPVYIISLATFIIFFQGFMVAPLLPMLSDHFHTSVRHVSFIEPAYLLGYGVFTLVYAPMSEKYGRFKIIALSMLLFIVLTAGTAAVNNIDHMIALRLLTGMGAAGVAPTTISWISDTHPYEQRGHALGIFFGCMAGGAAFGSSIGAVLSSLVGWRYLFIGVSAVGFAILITIIKLKIWLFGNQRMIVAERRNVLSSFREILSKARAKRTYAYVLLNGMFHSGIFAWLGYYLHLNYGLSEMQIGLALLGYGIPGLMLGPSLGKLADRYGRNKIIPIGILISAIAVLVLSQVPSLIASCLLVTFLSFGFDLSHPLFAAIVTTFSANKGAATGLFAFFLFLGYGLGSLVLSLIVSVGLNTAFQYYGICALIGSIISFFIFRDER